MDRDLSAGFGCCLFCLTSSPNNLWVIKQYKLRPLASLDLFATPSISLPIRVRLANGGGHIGTSRRVSILGSIYRQTFVSGVGEIGVLLFYKFTLRVVKTVDY